jgi:hypothetical protein
VEENMQKKFIFLLLVVFMIIPVIAQDVDPDAVTTANSQITEIRLSGFEDASFWKVAMSPDQGLVTVRSFIGKPKDLSGDLWTECDC